MVGVDVRIEEQRIQDHIRQRIGLLPVATGEHTAGQDQLRRRPFDAERAYGPYHPLPGDLRRALEHQRRLGRGS